MYLRPSGYEPDMNVFINNDINFEINTKRCIEIRFILRLLKQIILYSFYKLYKNKGVIMKKLTISIIVFTIFIEINFCNSQWFQMNAPNTGIVNSFTGNGVNIFSGFNNYPTGTGGVYLSTNNGQSWIQTSFNNKDINSLDICNSIIFAGFNNYPSTNGGIKFSDNNGLNWTSTLFPNYNVFKLAVSNLNIFAGCEDTPPGNGGVYRSTNGGLTWTQTFLNNQNVSSFAINGSYIYAGVNSSSANGVYLSTNNGQNWSLPTLNNQTISCLIANGSLIFAGTLNGIFVSSNNGQNWSQTSLNNYWVLSFEKYGSNIFAGTNNNSGGVFFSSNNGQNWTQINQGFNIIPKIRALFISNNYIFAGTYQNGIWRRLLSEIVVEYNSNITNIPRQHSLFQNFPNPFNPITNIKYELYRNSNIRITIFDITGHEIETLVNNYQKEGLHEVYFDGYKFPSGIYFYKLETNNFSETKKMVLLK